MLDSMNDSPFLPPPSSKAYPRSTDYLQPSKEFEPLKRHLSSLTLSESLKIDDQDWASVNGSDASRDSFASRSVSELNWSEPRQNEDKRSASVCSINSSVFKVRPIERCQENFDRTWWSSGSFRTRTSRAMKQKRQRSV